ncbi:hypothetical protein [Benzoatithermus flavus]|uniref:Response regulatory domain-containing protein n=1 Tax=Benzoatithermus flavus TaxID=3108223 RepID=A0ABU8XWL0_9PROT
MRHRPIPAAPSSGNEQPDTRGPLVLVVEDEALTALDLEYTLLDAGYRVLGPAGRVEDALGLVRSTRPDAAVLDVSLAGDFVWPLAAMLRLIAVPFLFYTSFIRSDFPESMWDDALLLPKPASPQRMLEAVASLFVPAG